MIDWTTLQGLLFRSLWHTLRLFLLSLTIDKVLRNRPEKGLERVDRMLGRLDAVNHWLMLVNAGLEARETVVENTED